MATLTVPRPRWNIVYNNLSIVSDIEDQVTEVRWCERIGGQAAEASFTVDDSLRKWQSSTYPKPTDRVGLFIGYAGALLHECGTFTVDEFELTAPPDRMEVKCVELWVSKGFLTPNAQVYQGMTFEQIASLIAQKYGLTAVLAPGAPAIEWNLKVQVLEDGGDIGFLQRLADEYNFELAVRPPQLIFYYRPALEAQKPTGAPLTRQAVKRAQFRYQCLADPTYQGASGSYPDPVTGQTFTGQAASAPAPTTANQLNYGNIRVENNQQAAAMAASALHQQNVLLFQATLDIPGTTAYLSGQTVSLPSSDWGIFGGTWLIEESEHTLRPAEGYMTKLTMRTPAPPAIQITPGGAAAA